MEAIISQAKIYVCFAFPADYFHNTDNDRIKAMQAISSLAAPFPSISAIFLRADIFLIPSVDANLARHAAFPTNVPIIDVLSTQKKY